MSFTWNPFSGCSGNCPWCYARAIYERFGMDFTPTWHEDRLMEPIRKREPSLIFCGSTGDIADVSESHAQAVLEVMRATARHQYLILTKRPSQLPACFAEKTLPSNLWLGISASNQKEFDTRMQDLTTLPLISCDKTQIPLVASLEPLLDLIDVRDRAHQLSWVIVGGKSPGKALHESGAAPYAWLMETIRHALGENLPVMYKHSGRSLPVFKYEYPADGLCFRICYDDNPMREALERWKEHCHE